MNNIRKYTAWLGAGAIMITLATGCAGPNDTVVENVASAAVDATGNVAEGAVDATSNVVDAAGNNIAPAGQVVENSAEAGVSNVEALGDAATYTPKIKTALGANSAMAGSSINVDTMGEKNTIVLSGTVTSQAQKDLAESIAKKNAPGYTIDNQLTMAGGKM